jgi:anti-sigma factor RsiW
VTIVDACERYLNAIHELVDGTLGPIRRAELELHLETCDRCRALAADLQEIARAAESLDDIEPPARVWAAVSAQLRAERDMTAPAKTFVRHRSVAMLAIAATLVIAVGASLFLLRTTPMRTGSTPPAQSAQTIPPAQTPTPPPSAAAGNAGPDDPVQSVVKELAATETQFERLVQATEASAIVDPKTAATMQKNLQVMNEAINESRKALAADPQNAPARASIYEVLKQKIQFLQETIALMNEMWQGDAAGAAAIVEGGKS